MINFLEKLLDDNLLMNTNGEVCDNVDTWFVTMAASGGTTITSYLDKEQCKDITNLANYIKCSLKKSVNAFDTDRAFNELWSEAFGRHNGFTPGQFLKILSEDEDEIASQVDQMDVDKDIENYGRDKLIEEIKSTS